MSTGDELDPGAKRLWPLIREQVAVTSAAGQDDRRLRGVLARRRAKSQEFSSAAGDWDRLRSDLFGDTFYLWGVLGLIDPALVVGDLGCGTGQLTEIVARRMRQVVAVDSSADMLDAARVRLGGAANVDLRQGELESLPIKAGELDAAMLARPALLAVTGTRARGSRAACSGPAGACWSWICCRTSSRNISSRWATCGSGSRRSRSKVLDGCGIQRCPDALLPADPGKRGPRVVCGGRDEGVIQN